MYFVYPKQINVASEYSYDVDSLVEWFENYIDPEEIISDYGKDVTAKDIVDAIFSNPDVWYADFVDHYEFEEDLLENTTEEDIAEQLNEVISDSLIQYYKNYLEDVY